jgi:hypothetical protein
MRRRIAKALGNRQTFSPNEWPVLDACPAHAWRIRKTGTTIPQCISRSSFLASHFYFQQALNFSPANGIYIGKPLTLEEDVSRVSRRCAFRLNAPGSLQINPDATGRTHELVQRACPGTNVTNRLVTERCLVNQKNFLGLSSVSRHGPKTVLLWK